MYLEKSVWLECVKRKTNRRFERTDVATRHEQKARDKERLQCAEKTYSRRRKAY